MQNSESEIRVFLDAKNPKLRRLPWQEWGLLASRFPQAEIVMRVRGKGGLKPSPSYGKLRSIPAYSLRSRFDSGKPDAFSYKYYLSWNRNLISMGTFLSRNTNT
ncbi:MAG: hypothetical protein F6K25_20900 [Okeania sp. SIO2G4]|uniref:hypothetical protein n=1 Tax=unclassified Okeania TaxID=2634635 RepID=UPI0013BD4CA8|nr:MULTISPECIES: hypothetical protein [unclassified Okeania]NEP05622.1 hypothetical protein [Okeania sp. SIO4D6]NEP40037.1 hypothetical protein [Okeania sp. SIO2H7]NEP74269.1 hypothetical protein [Okeania sp. SIO2G5]NEP95268.1 hypothetical protein [Okeania sp. SIO2F5]NEQ92991.1 hypothetical protein [Okeania sp. SIO2G4]